MKYKLLIFGFFTVISLMVVIVIFALNINHQTIISFEKGEKNFKEIATAATEVSSYAKRAEGHLLMYLALNKKTDKNKFPKRVASLNEKITIIDQKIVNPQAKMIFEKIKAHTNGILSMGNALIADCEKTLKNENNYKIKKNQELILILHDKFSSIRALGVNLSKFEIKLESDLKLTLKKNAKRLDFHLLLLISLTFVITLFLGYILNKIIKALNEEVAIRIKFETELIEESIKLKNALIRVKELSGLLPICASCKKIRDEKGNWNEIESYIKNHSNAEFSHGICPECLQKTLAEYITDKN